MRHLKQTHSRHIANTLYMSCTRGCSINDDFQSPEKGYMVGGYGEELIFPNITSVNLGKVEDWINKHELKNFQYYGVWVDKNKVYFDVSTNLQSKKEAISEGKKKKQLAIWDLNKNEEIVLSNEKGDKE